MNKLIIVTALSASIFSLQTQADILKISIKNVSSAAYFTPLLVASHNKKVNLFELGKPASVELQTQAEGGDAMPLKNSIEMSGNGKGIIIDGMIAPGTTRTFTINTGHQRFLSMSSMILPTNDGFVGVDSWRIPYWPGTYKIQMKGYDAGTELNNELIVPNTGGMPGVLGIPGDPTGKSGTNGFVASEALYESNVVHIHPGIRGDEELSGGSSDLNRFIHPWSNPLAEVTIRVKKKYNHD